MTGMALPEISPLSALPPQWLIDYLAERGTAADVTQWKYFAADYDRGRERGYGAVADGKKGQVHRRHRATRTADDWAS